MDRESKPPLVFLVGPTASGKSDFALSLAKRLQGEILSADSRLVYRGMDIGTAKPSLETRRSVPHHLIDVTDPDHPWSLAVFQRAALEVFQQVTDRGRLPILVGGTGQYVRSLLEGWVIPPARPDSGLREQLSLRMEQEGPDSLYRELKERDPAAAARIDPRNRRRVIRALEVLLDTGRSFSEQRARGDIPFRPIILGLQMERPELYRRIDLRIDTMMAAGWLEEVRSLLRKGYSPSLPAFSALGYPQVIRHLKGEIHYEECISEIRRITRRLVRQQANWFPPDASTIRWLTVPPYPENETETAIRLWLKENTHPRG